MRAFLIAGALALGLTAAQAQSVPQFRDYPATVYNGKPARVILDDESKRMFRTRLRDAVKEPANFAGHFNIVTWGCGTNCLVGAVVDRKTGRVLDLPQGDEVELFDIKHRPNSSLLVTTNRSYMPMMDDERVPTWFFYRFDGSRFHLIHTHREPNKKWDGFPIE